MLVTFKERKFTNEEFPLLIKNTSAKCVGMIESLQNTVSTEEYYLKRFLEYPESSNHHILVIIIFYYMPH